MVKIRDDIPRRVYSTFTHDDVENENYVINLANNDNSSCNTNGLCDHQFMQSYKITYNINNDELSKCADILEEYLSCYDLSLDELMYSELKTKNEVLEDFNNYNASVDDKSLLKKILEYGFGIINYEKQVDIHDVTYMESSENLTQHPYLQEMKEYYNLSDTSLKKYANEIRIYLLHAGYTLESLMDVSRTKSNATNEVKAYKNYLEKQGYVKTNFDTKLRIIKRFYEMTFGKLNFDRNYKSNPKKNNNLIPLPEYLFKTSKYVNHPIMKKFLNAKKPTKQTRTRYISIIRTYQKYYKLTLDEMTSATRKPEDIINEVKDYLNYKKGTGLKDESLTHHIDAIKRFYEFFYGNIFGFEFSHRANNGKEIKNYINSVQEHPHFKEYSEYFNLTNSTARTYASAINDYCFINNINYDTMITPRGEDVIKDETIEYRRNLKNRKLHEKTIQKTVGYIFRFYEYLGFIKRPSPDTSNLKDKVLLELNKHPLVKPFIDEMDITMRSKNFYVSCIRKYMEYHKMSLDELMEEARNEQIRIKNSNHRSIGQRLHDFKQYLKLNTGLSTYTINSSCRKVKRFYEYHGIKIPEKPIIKNNTRKRGYSRPNLNVRYAPIPSPIIVLERRADW